jgi:hypothetical protein
MVRANAARYWSGREPLRVGGARKDTGEKAILPMNIPIESSLMMEIQAWILDRQDSAKVEL